jgi:hypothetical protein
LETNVRSVVRELHLGAGHVKAQHQVMRARSHDAVVDQPSAALPIECHPARMGYPLAGKLIFSAEDFNVARG